MKAFNRKATLLSCSLALVLCGAGSVYPGQGRQTSAPDGSGQQGHSALWHFYQHTIGQADGDRCPMCPSCSAYAEQAIRKHGWLIGWIMTFDRFLHEGTETERAVHGVRYRNDKLVVVNEVVHNDFWWASAKEMAPGDLMSIGRDALRSEEWGVPDRLDGLPDEELRLAGVTFLRAGSYREAAMLYTTLWARSRRTSDALFAAYSLLLDRQAAASAALLEEVLEHEDVVADDKTIALFAQGLAFRDLALYNAAADSFQRALLSSREETARTVIQGYLVEAQLKADNWNEAASSIDALGTPMAMAIQRELTEDLPWRSPALAGTMSAVLPGSGQLYCGRYQEAFWAFVVVGSFALASYEAFDRDLNWVGAATTLTGLSWYSGNIYGAVNAAHKYNRRERDKRITSWTERLGVRQSLDSLTLMLKFEF